MPTSLPKLILIELIGTFFLSLLVGMLLLNQGTGGYVSLYLPLGAATAFGLLTYCFEGAGSALFNPAVALGLFVANRLSAKMLLVSLLAEVIGAYLGIMLARYLSDAPLLAPQGYALRADLGELLGSAIFVFAIVRIALGQVAPVMSGVVSGAALLVGLSIAQAVSGGLLNPALAIGLGAFHVSYLLMPLLGGLLGAYLARSLQPALPTYS